MKGGVIAGYPLVDIRARLVFGSYHEVDSSSRPFSSAPPVLQGSGAEGRSGAARAHHGLEVVTPEEYMGDVMGDLNGRRGRIAKMDSRANAQIITALCRFPPVSASHGSALQVSGPATFTMQFNHYEKVPAQLAEEICKRK